MIYIRLADYAMNSDTAADSLNQDIDIFQLFKKSIDRIIQENTVNMELKKLLDLQVIFFIYLKL